MLPTLPTESDQQKQLLNEQLDALRTIKKLSTAVKSKAQSSTSRKFSEQLLHKLVKLSKGLVAKEKKVPGGTTPLTSKAMASKAPTSRLVRGLTKTDANIASHIADGLGTTKTPTPAPTQSPEVPLPLMKATVAALDKKLRSRAQQLQNASSLAHGLLNIASATPSFLPTLAPTYPTREFLARQLLKQRLSALDILKKLSNSVRGRGSPEALP